MATYRGVEVDLSVTAGMQTAARRALDWRSSGRPGMTQVGMATARAIVAGGELSPQRWRQIARFFPRFERLKSSEGFNTGEPGYPTRGRVAWDGWGGDPGRSRSAAIVQRLNRIDGRAS